MTGRLTSTGRRDGGEGARRPARRSCCAVAKLCCRASFSAFRAWGEPAQERRNIGQDIIFEEKRLQQKRLTSQACRRRGHEPGRDSLAATTTRQPEHRV